MAAPVYSTDLTDITLSISTTNWTALGGGSAGLNTETDYFIEGSQCVSKNGFTASTKGMIFNAGATTITAGDAVIIWVKQNNRNLMDTVTNGGTQICIGSGTGDYDQFYVDGSEVQGSDLAGWFLYAVDPTESPSTTTGSPTATTSHFGVLWKILGSGSLKGAPNGIDAIRHGRELRMTDGDAGNGYATFDGAAAYDEDTTRRWGLLTPTAGGYWLQGHIVLGQSGTPVDFRDSNRNLIVLQNFYASSTFNEISIVDASSNVEWTNIQIQHLGTSSPTTLNLDVGTFTGESCRFDACGVTTFSSSQSCINTTWANSGQVILAEADISGSSILTSTVAADEGAVYDNRTTTGATNISELDNCTFSQGTNAHHAIRFGANVDDDITLTGIEFTGFSSSDDVNGSTLRFDATTGTMNCNLISCTVDGNPATTANVGVDDAAGITVTLVIDPVTTKFTVEDINGSAIASSRVLAETADDGGGSGFPFEDSVSITQSAGTATVTHTAHGLATGDYIVIRGAQPDDYNKQASITVTGANAYTYSVDSGASSPATGSPVASYAAVSGTTNGSGVIQSSKTWPASQGLKGWARKSNTVSPFYKEASINVADASNGTDATLTLLPDE